MKITMKCNLMTLGVAMFAVAMLTAGDAHANNFSSISKNILESIANLPALLSGLAYMFGMLLSVLGIMKIKDHVENPGQTPLKDGAIRLAAGGGLFTLPIITQAMTETIGSSGQGATIASTTQITFAT